MLTVLRSVLPAGKAPAGESGRVEMDACEEGGGFPLEDGRIGRADEETARLAAAGAGSREPEVARDADAVPTLETRDFATGNEGSGPVGGATEGREGRGREWFFMLLKEWK